ncbi:MAG: response regulator transcription factor [Comamonadaceae bacterium]|nr:MAG: response regulator transcription factor [Comamonadaceae bacterium]
MHTLVLTDAPSPRILAELERCVSRVTVIDRERAWAELQGKPFDLLVLDRLPWRYARQLLLRLRKSRPCALPDAWIPVLVTGMAEESGRVQVLDAGADACLRNGCDDEEFAATIRALWRRRMHGQAQVQAPPRELVVHRALRTVTKDGRPVPLTPPEFSVLSRLMEARPGLVTGREMRAHLGAQHEVRSMQSVVFQLRTKIGRKAVGTVRGHGYRLAVEARWDDLQPALPAGAPG